MYCIVSLIAVCVFAAIINGVRLSISAEPESKIQELSKEERLRQIYRNAYFSYVALNAEALEDK